MVHSFPSDQTVLSPLQGHWPCPAVVRLQHPLVQRSGSFFCLSGGSPTSAPASDQPLRRFAPLARRFRRRTTLALSGPRGRRSASVAATAFAPFVRLRQLRVELRCGCRDDLQLPPEPVSGPLLRVRHPTRVRGRQLPGGAVDLSLGMSDAGSIPARKIQFLRNFISPFCSPWAGPMVRPVPRAPAPLPKRSFTSPRVASTPPPPPSAWSNWVVPTNGWPTSASRSSAPAVATCVIPTWPPQALPEPCSNRSQRP